MKTATVRQLRHEFGAVLTWVEEGEQVRISKRGKVIALLTPPPPAKARPPRKRPDFAARLKRIYGTSRFTGNAVVEERESRRY